MCDKLRGIELLAPAGDMECVETAIRFGANAVYAGGNMLQLRAASAGFDMDKLQKAAIELHGADRKLYVTVNAFAMNAELELLPEYARALYDMGVDAVIAADIGVLSTIKKAAPDLPVHVSTQANCVNYAAANMYYDMGAERVVLARELSIAEIAEIRAKAPKRLTLEAFVHGAMCMAYSGRCMISAFLTGRSANRGACAQSCRWDYHLTEMKRPNQFFPVEESENGMSILSSLDLNCIGFLDKLAEAGVESFKIEGRMKSPYYVACVTNAYRRRMDGDADIEALTDELNCVSHRPYSSGFYFGEIKSQQAHMGAYESSAVFVGVVKAATSGGIAFELRNAVSEGDIVEALTPNSKPVKFEARNIRDEQGARTSRAAVPGRIYQMDCPQALDSGDFLRIRI